MDGKIHRFARTGGRNDALRATPHVSSGMQMTAAICMLRKPGQRELVIPGLRRREPHRATLARR